MEFTQELVDRLRRKLGDELGFTNNDESTVLMAFDRAVLATVLDGGSAPTTKNKGPVAGSAAARKRGLKAAATRKANLEKKKGEGNASNASDS